MKQLYKKIIRPFSAPQVLALPEPSWEAEYLVQKFLKRYVSYPETAVRHAVQCVLQHTAVPRPGDSLLKEVVEQLEKREE